MDNDRTYKSLVATACYIVENQCGAREARGIYDRFWSTPLPPEECTPDFAGELLRQGGVGSVACMARPELVKSMVVQTVNRLSAAMVAFKHPAVHGETRWLCAYGLSPDGMLAAVGLEPNEPSLRPSELWQNVTGAVVLVTEPFPNEVIIEIVGLSPI